MTKPKKIRISPSQVKTRRQCDRLIGFQYVEGIRPPSSVKQEFGTDVHKHLEEWLRDGKLPDKSPAGEVAKQGLSWLPAPQVNLWTEHEFEFLWSELTNVFVHGFIDCIKHPEWELGQHDKKFIVAPPLVIDHKSTGDLRWAMDTSSLTKDPQAILYSLYAMFKWNVPFVKARWIYYAASNPKSGRRKPSGAKPVEVTFDHNSIAFREQVKQIGKDIEQIVHIRREGIPGKVLRPNPASCQMYGGCFFQDQCNLSADERLAGYMTREDILKSW